MTRSETDHDQLVKELDRLRRRNEELEAKQAADQDRDELLAALTAALNLAPVMAAWCDPSLVCRQANRRLEEALELPPDGAVGRTLESLFGAGIWAEMTEPVASCLEGFEVSFELSPSSQDWIGDSRWLLSLAPLFRPDESVGGIILVAVDHTAHRRLESDYRIALELTRMLVDQDQALICRLDDNLRHRFTNLAYRDFYDRTEGGLIGRTLAEVMGPEEYAAVEDHLAAALSGREISFERTFTSPSGAEAPLFATYYPQIGATGRKRGIIIRLAHPDQARNLPGGVWRYEVWRPADRTDLNRLTKRLLTACENEWLARGFKGVIRLRTAAQEAILNAYEHGNDQDSTKPIIIGYRFGSRLHLTVEDQGPGFDPDALPDPTAPENLLKERGRGVCLIKAAADQVNWRNQGRKVYLIFEPDSAISAPD